MTASTALRRTRAASARPAVVNDLLADLARIEARAFDLATDHNESPLEGGWPQLAAEGEAVAAARDAVTTVERDLAQAAAAVRRDCQAAAESGDAQQVAAHLDQARLAFSLAEGAGVIVARRAAEHRSAVRRYARVAAEPPPEVLAAHRDRLLERAETLHREYAGAVAAVVAIAGDLDATDRALAAGATDPVDAARWVSLRETLPGGAELSRLQRGGRFHHPRVLHGILHDGWTPLWRYDSVETDDGAGGRRSVPLIDAANLPPAD